MLFEGKSFQYFRIYFVWLSHNYHKRSVSYNQGQRNKKRPKNLQDNNFFSYIFFSNFSTSSFVLPLLPLWRDGGKQGRITNEILIFFLHIYFYTSQKASTAVGVFCFICLLRHICINVRAEPSFLPKNVLTDCFSIDLL